ncbi:uncharacterized protein P174DRAFT_434489 [Aspergillus novofumigatus IBT 16806]|uniref:Uncharacterized protein n=1 Tax=Aspergillus novofumigatus (strain IBT 16806) TaxID=1392255 RepID=A0A2I1BXI3_ASPN1|nr:uncharacterized protein P174DRAFT_434489 [Aspergillus novofumigatus IBT 16806]PKX90069.1 hypothetical protein P174DRAFT_434489 [Aspergillus novofumigatus IBT 16806]
MAQNGTEWYKDLPRLKDLESAISMQEGLGRFLLPPTTADLIDEARRAPIVVFNATEIRNDALIITEYDGIAGSTIRRRMRLAPPIRAKYKDAHDCHVPNGV